MLDRQSAEASRLPADEKTLNRPKSNGRACHRAANLQTGDDPVKRKKYTDNCAVSNHYSIDDVRAFCFAARTGQFQEAAELLFISPSALSRRIASIEENIGGQVFHRSTRKVQLTQLGIAFYEEVSPLLAQLDGSFTRATRMARGDEGHLVVAMVATIAYSLLPEALDTFYKAHPGVFVSVRDGIAASIASLVEQRQAEFGIATQMAFAATIHAERMGTYGFNLVGPPADPWFKSRKKVGWAELSGKRVIGLNPLSSTRLQVDAELSSRGIDLPWSMDVDQFSTMLGLVREKGYFAVLPTLFDAKRYGLSVLPITTPVMSRQLFFIRRRDSPLSPQADRLAALLRIAVAKEHPLS